MRFTLTAGQKGDAPQAATLIEGLPAEVVMADTAYDADHLRQAIAAKGAIAVIPNNPSRALKYPLDKHLYAQRHLVECCFSHRIGRKPANFSIGPFGPPPAGEGADQPGSRAAISQSLPCSMNISHGL